MQPGEITRAGAVRAGAHAHDALDPRLQRDRARDRARHGADYRRLQVRPDPRRRPAGGRLAPGRARAGGRAAAVRGLDERRPAGLLAVGVGRGAAPGGGVRALRGADRRDQLRLEHPPRAAGRWTRRQALDRKVALVGRSMRKNTTIGRALGHIEVPDGTAGGIARDRRLPGRAGRDHLHRLSGRAAERAAADGLPRPSAGAVARGRHGRLLRDAGPRQRARGQRDDRPALPHRLRGRDPRATRPCTPPGTATPRRSS